MSKKLNKRQSPITQVEIEFNVTVKEVHCRTKTLCAKQSQNFSFPFGDDYEEAAEWLQCLDSDVHIGDFCKEICLDMGFGIGGTK